MAFKLLRLRVCRHALVFTKTLTELFTRRHDAFRIWLIAIAHNVIADCF